MDVTICGVSEVIEKKVLVPGRIVGLTKWEGREAKVLILDEQSESEQSE